jgi:hypothetical protein
MGGMRERNTAVVRVGIGLAGLVVATLLLALPTIMNLSGSDLRWAFAVMAAVSVWMIANSLRTLQRRGPN